MGKCCLLGLKTSQDVLTVNFISKMWFFECVLWQCVLQMRTSVRSGTLVLTLVTTPWAPTTARVHEASPFQQMAGRARVPMQPTRQRYRRRRLRLRRSPSLLADIDECSLEGRVCHNGQDCENTIGSYRCVMRCGRGFRRTADGLSCTGASGVFRSVRGDWNI